jgi:hypothetical protein
LHRMLGYVPEIVIQELGQDMERARAAGLVLSTDLNARQPAAGRGVN